MWRSLTRCGARPGASARRWLFLTDRPQPPNKTAIIHEDGQRFTYGQLLADSAALAGRLLAAAGGADLAGRRVPFLAPANYDYVVMQWAIWRSGGVAVPLSAHHTAAEMAYYINVRAS
jgi:malonyl-CoA/methylmalonyl-CoA synthetase